MKRKCLWSPGAHIFTQFFHTHNFFSLYSVEFVYLILKRVVGKVYSNKETHYHKKCRNNKLEKNLFWKEEKKKLPKI